LIIIVTFIDFIRSII